MGYRKEGGKERRQNREGRKDGGTRAAPARFVISTLTVSSHFSHTPFTILGKYDCMKPRKTPGPLNNILGGSDTDRPTDTGDRLLTASASFACCQPLLCLINTKPRLHMHFTKEAELPKQFLPVLTTQHALDFSKKDAFNLEGHL